MSEPYNTFGHIEFSSNRSFELNSARHVLDRIFDMILNDKLNQFKSTQMMLKPWADMTLSELAVIDSAKQQAREAALCVIDVCASNQLPLEPSKPTSPQYGFIKSLGQTLTKLFKQSKTAATPPPFALSFTQ